MNFFSIRIPKIAVCSSQSCEVYYRTKFFISEEKCFCDYQSFVDLTFESSVVGNGNLVDELPGFRVNFHANEQWQCAVAS